jgi:site-specific DNA recombinase
MSEKVVCNAAALSKNESAISDTNLTKPAFNTESSAGSLVIPSIIYARVSTDEQTKGYSIQTQIESCRKYASERGYCVLAEFTDDYTGDSMDRPGLNSLREYILINTVSLIIVYCVDRMARKCVYQMLIEEEFERVGITVEYMMGQYSNNDEGRLQKQIQGSISEYERAKIMERSKRGKIGKAKSGYVIFGARPPYGYYIKSEPHKSWLEIDEQEAEIVRLVFQWYVNGEGESKPFSIQKITLQLTKMHIPTRGDKVKHVAKKRGLGVWTGGMVRHILMNETYLGVWYYGKTHMVNDGKANKRKSGAKRGFGKQVGRPRAEWIPVKVPSIIDKDPFERARERRLLNFEQSKRNAKHEYLLGRRLRCAKCGYTYQGRTRREKNQYYCCHGKEQRPVPLCNMPNFKANRLESRVWEWLRRMLLHPDRLAQGLRGKRAELEAANNVVRERLSLLESRISETQSQLSKLLDLYLEGNFAKDILNSRKTELEKVLSDMIQEQTELASYLIPVNLSDEDIEVIKSFCSEVRSGLDNATFEDKRRYMELLDVRCKLALENQEKVAYVKCKLGAQRLSVVLTSPSSSIHNRPPIEVTARLVIERLNQDKDTRYPADPVSSQEITIPNDVHRGNYGHQAQWLR